MEVFCCKSRHIDNKLEKHRKIRTALNVFVSLLLENGRAGAAAAPDPAVGVVVGAASSRSRWTWRLRQMGKFASVDLLGQRKSWNFVGFLVTGEEPF